MSLYLFPGVQGPPGQPGQPGEGTQYAENTSLSVTKRRNILSNCII